MNNRSSSSLLPETGTGEQHWEFARPDPSSGASARSHSESPQTQTILIIDDDENLRDTVSLMLEREGFRTVLSAEGREGFEQALMLRPDLILVDLRLPGMSGAEICKELRGSKVTTPIVVLSAVGDEIDKVLLLEIGADDYIVKPFGARELVARIRAVLRRSTAESRRVLHVGPIEVDLERRVVTKGDQEIRLTPAEFNLLAFFLNHPDRPLTREMVLNSVWGYAYGSNTRTVDAHILKLRQKLEATPNVPRHFLTVHGVGYRFLP